jgi:hypothetical protein
MPDVGATSQALEAWSRVLAPLEPAAQPSAGDALELLGPLLSPVPFQDRKPELAHLASFLTGDIPCYVLRGTAGAGKTRLALEAGRRAHGWATGWLRPGAGDGACAAVRERGERTLILVDDADLRADLLPLLDQVCEHRSAWRSPTIRVLVVTRSNQDLIQRSRAAVGGRPPGHAKLQYWASSWLAGPPRSADQVFRAAVSAFASVTGVLTDDTPAAAGPPGPAGAEPESFGVIVARALLLVLDQARGTALPGPPEGDPRSISRARLAARLIGHEQDRWAAATEWDWGGHELPSRALQARVLAALTLLGADSAAAAGDVLALVPMPRDAGAGLRDAIASWAASLYPPWTLIGISPQLAAERFVVRQLAGSPRLARHLRAELTQDQRARALGLLGRAVGHVRGAGRLFGEFAGDSTDSLAIAIGQAVVADAPRRHDAVLADRVRCPRQAAPGGWEPAQLARLGAVPAWSLPQTSAAIGEARTACYRTMAASSAVYWPGLARALSQLGFFLAAAGQPAAARAAKQEAAVLRRGLEAGTAGVPKKLRYLLSPANEPDAGRVLSFTRDLPARQEYRQVMLQLARGLLGSSPPGSAVAAAQEAVAAERELIIAARQPDGPPWRELAAALDVLGDALARAGHYPEAILATMEAARHWRPGDGRVRSFADTGYLEALLALSTRLGQAAQPEAARAARGAALRAIRASLVRGGTCQDRYFGRLGHPVGARENEANRPARLVAELAYEELTVIGTGPSGGPAGRRGVTLEGARLDLGQLLTEFAAFWRRNGGVPDKKGWYPGAAPDQVFAALLERLMDGAGTVELRGQARERRRPGPVRPRRYEWTEILVHARYDDPAGVNVEQRDAIQLVETRTQSGLPRGQSASAFLRRTRMDDYLTGNRLREGALVIFDRRPRPVSAWPDPRLSRARTQLGREIVVLTC